LNGLGMAISGNWQFSGLTAENAINQDVALQNIIETGRDDGEPMLIRCAAVCLDPLAGDAVSLVKSRKQAFEMGRADRQEGTRWLVEEFVGIEQLHCVAVRRARQGQLGECEAVTKSVKAEFKSGHGLFYPQGLLEAPHAKMKNCNNNLTGMSCSDV